MTAREQAEAAARKLADRSDFWWLDDSLAEAADAASDIWEPLLREAFEYMRDSHPGNPAGGCYACAITDRLREALGE